MTYEAELDDVRQEVRYGYAGNVLTHWPKRPGVGNVDVTGTPTYTIEDPAGTQLASGSMTVTATSSIDKLTVTVDASSSASYPLDTDFSLIITYVYDSITYVETVRFDCVLEPYTPSISINDLLEEVADIRQRLTRQGAQIVSGRTADQVASVLGVRAWADIRQRIVAKLDAQGTTRPFMIIDREPLRAVVVAKAIALAYRAEGGGIDSESRQLALDWEAEASARFAGMGTLKIATGTDRSVDARVTGWGVVPARRTQ